MILRTACALDSSSEGLGCARIDGADGLWNPDGRAVWARLHSHLLNVGAPVSATALPPPSTGAALF
jgi:hypothetical protein